jgi:hypothetical protein
MTTFLSTYALHSRGPAPTGDLGDVPTELKDLFEQVGTSTYANAFFAFVAPETFEHYLELIDISPAEVRVFLKCGFGHLIFFHRQQYKALNPIFNDVDVLGEAGELDFVMDTMLCDRPAMENSFMLDVYEQSFPRLGPPDRDEIYAFVPALKLGGARNAANVRRSKMDVEMQILLQL